MTIQKFKLLTISIISVLLSFSSLSYAQTISHHIKSVNIEAEADYLSADIDKPAVIIIHGFLTTNKFHTIGSMAKALQDEGFSTLTPTLTLDINKRKSSIKCNSVHTHTLEKDVLEIKEWVEWLKSKGHKKVIVVGHSSGSQELLEYLNKYPSPTIKGAVFTSLFYLSGKELGTLENEIVFAEDLLAKKENRPSKYSFLFCKNNYFATPESYLSYMKLDRNYVLSLLENLKVPSYTIMGSADKRYLSVGENWLNDLENTGTNLITVEGANHFFSSEHEFDLQDHLVEIIKQLSDN
ncbi:alpha/beta hydrolase [Thiomicrorhabdus lithotrophica]|uniref:Alpha/beta hydrolase n=1 Tax=Thiomicrorhabdus lithotrophica TaxID=2949997 RepID=A0ABY8C7S3_9GAMM|nr:alpha/beta hydrolase [Thiomicrorhabdus lithotrophica]WEJ62018.1 alpha/beta hydrolase [Thiomicrorhabdus lithotrophica]